MAYWVLSSSSGHHLGISQSYGLRTQLHRVHVPAPVDTGYVQFLSDEGVRFSCSPSGQLETASPQVPCQGASRGSHLLDHSQEGHCM